MYLANRTFISKIQPKLQGESGAMYYPFVLMQEVMIVLVSLIPCQATLCFLADITSPLQFGIYCHNREHSPIFIK